MCTLISVVKCKCKSKKRRDKKKITKMSTNVFKKYDYLVPQIQ